MFSNKVSLTKAQIESVREYWYVQQRKRSQEATDHGWLEGGVCTKEERGGRIEAFAWVKKEARWGRGNKEN